MGFANAEIGASQNSNGVITIEKIGTSARGLLNYVSQYAKTGTYRPFMTNMVGAGCDLSPRALATEFAAVRKLKPKLKRAVSHLIVSCGNGLSENQLKLAIDTTLKMNGYEQSMFAAYIHKDTDHEHIHIFASRIYVSEDGKPAVVSDSNSFKRVHAGSREVERVLGVVPIQMRETAEKNHGADKAYTALKREARIKKESRRRSPDGHDELVPTISEINSQTTTKKGLGMEIKQLEEAIKSILQDESVIDLSRFEEEIREKTGRDIEWARSGSVSADVVGWTLVAAGGTRLKGSEVSRSLAYKNVLAAVEENARRRRMARRQVEATARAIADTSETLAQAVPGAGAVVSLGLGQPRAAVTAKRPASKPGLFVLQPQGFGIPGYTANCIDAEQDTVVWEYRKAGSTTDLVFSDDGESFQLHGEALGDPIAIDLFLQSAAKRYGPSLALTLSEVPDRQTFLAMLHAAATLREIELIDASTRLPITSQQHKELAPAPAPVPEGAQSLDFLDVRPNSAPRKASAAAAGAGQGEAPAAPAPAQAWQSEAASVLVAPREDLAARRRAAETVLAMAAAEVTRPGPALGTLPRDAAKASAKDLREHLTRAEAFLPVAAWAEETKARHRAERGALGDGRSPADAVLAAATLRGDPLAEVVAQAAQGRVHAEACLVLARREQAERGAVQKAAEILNGKASARVAEIARLEAQGKDAEAAEARARRAYFEQPEVRRKVDETAELRATHHAEGSAIGVVEALLRILAALVKELAALVKGAEARDLEVDRERARREDLQAHADALAAGQPEAVERDRQERAQRELEAQQEEQRGSIVFDRQRGG